MKTLITLSETEEKIAQHVGRKRYERNREESIKNNKIGPQGNEDTDTHSMAAEMACAKYLNLYPDFTINPRKGGPDLITRLGYAIDVKQTAHQTGHLLAVRSKRDETQVDFYVLMIGTIPTFEYVGWAGYDKLIREENLKNFGYGMSYGLAQSKLHGRST